MGSGPENPGGTPPLPEFLESRLVDILELPRDQQDTCLEALCREHPAHAAELRRLVKATRHSVAPTEWEPNRFAAAADPIEQIGPYRLGRVLGEGGMGTVYLAEQDEPVRRCVALKLIKPGMDSRQVLRRFEAERQALARMNHSNIAKVHDAGTTDRGQPYFVMEYVDGVPLTSYCDKHSLPVHERLALFCQVCSGVQHAHQKGIIHRDLKPSNVLVAVEDDRPVPKIIDFGLARATDQVRTQETAFTQRGQILGTPEYMSPEQADLGSQDVDARTDVYSLGVMLYELLVGSLPFPAAELRRAGLIEILRRIREEEPPRPSARLSQLGADGRRVAQARDTDTSALLTQLRGDLDWVVLRAIEKDRERRYGTATELAADLGRYLEHEPVLATPPSTFYRLRKFVRRNRAAVVVGTAALVMLLVGATVSIWFGIVATRMQNKAREEQVLSRLSNEFRRFQTQAAALLPEATRPELLEAVRRGDSMLQTHLPRFRRWLHDNQPAENPVDGGSPAPLVRDSVEQTVHDMEAFFADGGLMSKLRVQLSRIVVVERQHGPEWERARKAIRAADGKVASTLYAHHPIDLQPQVGLVPLGMDPVSKLWEFLHQGSGVRGKEFPERDDQTGRLLITHTTGIVFVLIPGGTFRMGAQSGDPSREDYDPLARQGVDSPPHDVRLEPYFLAKYEVTQAQWSRLAEGNPPSSWNRQTGLEYGVDDTHPVETISWDVADDTLRQHGLLLPTEAQWEYGCRAGSKSPWFTGKDAGTVAGYANLADQTAKEDGQPWPGFVSFTDGHVVHAPVGSFKPNDFGLHDTYGNVWEWCRDEMGTYDFPYEGPEGLCTVPPGVEQEELYRAHRLSRGGSYSTTTIMARSSARSANKTDVAVLVCGMRAARRIR